MELAPAIGTAPRTSTASGDSSAGTTGTSLASDLDTFLKLLTAQIRNQDPLEPADATEFTAQLATFSNVEQAVKTNDLLAQMIGRLDTQQVTQASGWIGMEVRHDGPIAHDGGSTVIHTGINAVADRAELVVRDEKGSEIGRHPIDPDAATIAWPAQGHGAEVPSGRYVLEVESWAGDRSLDTTPVSHYAAVREVVLGQGGTDLILDGGIRLPSDRMQSIRRPEA